MFQYVFLYSIVDSGKHSVHFAHVCGKVEKRTGTPVRGIAFPGLLAQVSLEMQ
jgi:hypothetical protein